KQQTQEACDRIFSRLQSGTDDLEEGPVVDLRGRRPRLQFTPARGGRWTRAAVLLAAAAAVILAVWLGTVWQNRLTSAVFENASGGLRRIELQEDVRTTNIGGVLTLTDGSRVEIRSESELRLERADDGMRIRLSRGGVIVNAAKQRRGHLYVQTKDVTVS